MVDTNFGQNTDDFLNGGFDLEMYNRHHDVRIDDVRIISFSGLDVSIIDHLDFFELHEDIFECSLSGRISSLDVSNLPTNLCLTGHELLVITFGTPGLPRITQVFTIDKISDKVQLDDKKSQMYDLHFVSSSFINNIFRGVSKSYSGTISSTVKSIFQTYINQDISSNAIKINVEQTMGDYKVVIPGWKPNVAINWLRRKAVSLGHYPSSNYVYYQDLDGFNFVSLASLYNNPVVATYSSLPVRSSEAREEDGPEMDLQKSLTNIERILVKGFDQSTESLNGTWSSTLLIHDITTKSYENFLYSYNKNFQPTKTLNGYPLLPQLTDHFSVQPDARNYMTPKHTGIHGGVSDVDGLKTIDYPDNEATWNHLQQHDAELNHLQFNSIEIVVAGDSNRRVGDKVAVQAPDVTGGEDNSGLDTMVSGIYLITKIKHTITPNSGHQMHMKLCKDSYGWGLPNEFVHEGGEEKGIGGVYHA